jgi:L-alanine-DL-glutamate epimerase-like enolase superfamily enzyme
MVLIEASADGCSGLGFTYADTATAHLARDILATCVIGVGAMDVPEAWSRMWASVRNLGRPGVCSLALSAVDIALWDLKSKLLDISLVDLLGAQRDAAPIYGSGGFTSYSVERLRQQLAGWVDQGFRGVKMKIGTHPDDDLGRVTAARKAIGPDVHLYVDANGAYDRKQALAQAERFAELGVMWFEEPVSSDDLDGLRLLRDRAPAGVRTTAGEYGYELWYFRQMLEGQAVDVLQADATRCGGVTGFLHAATLADSFRLEISAHCAPSMHLAACCAAPSLWPIEYLHDHVRIERMLFDGVARPVDGLLRPDRSRPGLGLELKRLHAERFRVL